jgi:uncharacterized membrane protein YbhN (UPF0104 family)
MRPVHPAWRRWLVWAVLIAVIAAAATLLGLDIRGWLGDVWDTITTISTASLVGYVVLLVVKTTATALAWYGILRYAFPDATRWRDVYAAYAVSVALNNILPANLGTLVMLIMFSITIAGATFAAILGAYAVEKIFFTLAGGFVYLYLFLTVGGSFDIKFAWVHEHPWATAIVVFGGTYLVVVALRRIWPRVVSWWDDAKDGGAILGRRRAYFGRVFLPSFVGWAAMLASIGVMLAAYDIPVTFDTIMHVAGGNSVANMTSVTPGGAGVNQAFNVASLRDVTTPENATAYSVASQLISTAWNILFAVALMVWAWGWTGGKDLVRTSYDEAKKREQEQREKRKEKKAAKAATS